MDAQRTRPSRVIYQLSDRGNDAWDGSAERPVATMDRALELFRPGDTIAPEGVIVPTGTQPPAGGALAPGLIVAAILTLGIGSSVALVVVILQHPILLAALAAMALVLAGALVASARRDTAACQCGHTRQSHQHYRPGTDCSGRVAHIAVDGVSLSRKCPCRKFRRPSVLARRLSSRSR